MCFGKVTKTDRDTNPIIGKHEEREEHRRVHRRKWVKSHVTQPPISSLTFTFRVPDLSRNKFFLMHVTRSVTLHHHCGSEMETQEISNRCLRLFMISYIVLDGSRVFSLIETESFDPFQRFFSMET